MGLRRVAKGFRRHVGREEGLRVYSVALPCRRVWVSTGLHHVALGEEGAGVYGAAPPSMSGGGSGRQQSRTAIHEVRRVWALARLGRDIQWKALNYGSPRPGVPPTPTSPSSQAPKSQYSVEGTEKWLAHLHVG
jgi:hypothetical protein